MFFKEGKSPYKQCDGFCCIHCIPDDDYNLDCEEDCSLCVFNYDCTLCGHYYECGHSKYTIDDLKG